MKLETRMVPAAALFPVWKALQEATLAARGEWLKWRDGKPNDEGKRQRLVPEALADLESDFKTKKRALKKLREELIDRDPVGFRKYTTEYYERELATG